MVGSSRSSTSGSLISERDREPALHATGEWLDAVVASFAQLYEVEELVDARPDHRLGQVEEATVDQQVLGDRQLHVEVVLLRNDTQPSADGRAIRRRVETEHAQRALGHRRDAADHAHRRALARAVRPEKAERLARRDLEVHGVDRGERTESFGECVRLDEGSHGRIDDTRGLACPLLTDPFSFAGRHIGPSDADVDKMLAALGYGSLDDLAAAAVPAAIKATEGLELAPATESEVLARCARWPIATG